MKRNLIYPKYSKNKVNDVAKKIVESLQNNVPLDKFDEEIIENWRAAHTHVLNTWQKIFSRRINPKSIVFAQRLKRKNTIYDKIKRFPKMNLARMHDIAGCRLIFKTIKDLENFKTELHKAKFHHFRKEEECKNYIKSPKESGYRGMHDVYVYKSRKGKGCSQNWDGLLIEIQYRTVYQHAWATAVEIADSLTKSRAKFSEGDEKLREFFRLASEIIARAYENSYSCKKELSDLQVVDQFMNLEDEIGLLKKLSQIKAIHKANILKKHAILLFDNENPLKPRVNIIQFSNLKEANEKYFSLEKSKPYLDIVLVSASGKIGQSIKSAYRNYFADTKDFATYVAEGSKILLDRYAKEINKIAEKLNQQ